jgi:hypothetical protein
VIPGQQLIPHNTARSNTQMAITFMPLMNIFPPNTHQTTKLVSRVLVSASEVDVRGYFSSI